MYNIKSIHIVPFYLNSGERIMAVILCDLKEVKFNFNIRVKGVIFDKNCMSQDQH